MGWVVFLFFSYLLMLYALFNYAVGILDCMSSNGWMINE